MNIESYYIPGTSRRRVICDDGTELQRQFVYMQDHQWENLKKLARLQGASGSQVIGRLIDLATTSFRQPR
jgi:hypothetical protein